MNSKNSGNFGSVCRFAVVALALVAGAVTAAAPAHAAASNFPSIKS